MKIELATKINSIEITDEDWGLYPNKEGVAFVNAAFTSTIIEDFNTGADRIEVNNKIIALSQNFIGFIRDQIKFINNLQEILDNLYGSDNHGR